MSDDNFTNPEDPFSADDEQQPQEHEPAASALFVHMMRQMAEQNAQRPPIQPVTDPLEALQPRTAQPPQPAPTISGLFDDLEADDAERSRRREAAMEEQRIRRIKRRRQRRRQRRRRRTVGVIGGFMRAFLVVLASAAMMATIFSWFTDADFLNPQTRTDLQVAIATNQATVHPTAQVTPNWLKRVGVVSGHRGPSRIQGAVGDDPGAVCPDGFTEAEVNFNVAQLVVRNLRQLGYSVDLLDEFDPRLDGYQAAALVSIHANTCQEWPNGEIVSGYLVAKAASRPDVGPDADLAECIATYYEQATGLLRRFNLTADMTDYHTFREIHARTPAAIIELGFMLADRNLLENEQERLAQAITQGIVCFLNPETRSPTPTPAATP